MDALEGEGLVGVAFANDRAEGDMIQGLLDSAGIPSVLQQTGIDGPGLGIGSLNPGGGSRRVMGDGSLYGYRETKGREPRSYGLIGAYGRIWAWSLGAMMLAFGVFLVLRMV